MGSFRNALLSFQMFEDFSVIEYYFDSIVVRQQTLYDFDSFKFVAICFLAYVVWSVLVYVSWVIRKNEHRTVVEWNFLSMSVGS